MKILEVLIASFLFVVFSTALSGLLFSVQSFLSWETARRAAFAQARTMLEEHSPEVIIEDVDNFTKRMKALVGEVSLSVLVVDTSESEGQSSCRPNQESTKWINPDVSSYDLQDIAPGIVPVDIDLVGHYAFVASNASRASSSDLFIFDISDHENVELVSEIDTGPGLAALSVAGNHVYVANTSINGQLQIIDINDVYSPHLVSSYKLPGEYDDGATVGNAIFYKAGKIFLGTQKSQITELHHIDVADPSHPREIGTYEIGNAVNDVFAFKNKVYVASPNTDELKSFRVSSEGSLSPFASYNNPGSTGNGKRLSLFLDTLYVGKTQTFAREELLALTAASSSSPRLRFGIALGSSVQGILGYGRIVFVLVRMASDNFIIYDTGGALPLRLNTAVNIPGLPLNFDCDRDTFATISEGNGFITFITPR